MMLSADDGGDIVAGLMADEELKDKVRIKIN